MDMAAGKFLKHRQIENEEGKSKVSPMEGLRSEDNSK